MLRDGGTSCAVLKVEDFKAIKPFDKLSSHPVFMVLERGTPTRYPVPYVRWERRTTPAAIRSVSGFLARCRARELVAIPVPGAAGGTTTRPWMLTTRRNLAAIRRVLQPRAAAYTARKDVTTDRNGIFWIEVLGVTAGEAVIRNRNTVDRTAGIPQ